jgi:hypothetical protein
MEEAGIIGSRAQSEYLKQMKAEEEEKKAIES